MSFLKRIIDAVLVLHHQVKKTGSKILTELEDDLAWHREVLNLELMAMIRQSGYDPHNREVLKLLARLKTGTSTTKELLESTFSFLTDVATRSNKNKRMGDNQKWFYSVGSPYGKDQAPHILPKAEDWLKYSTADSGLVSHFNSLRNLQNVRLPEIEFGSDDRFPQSAQDRAS